MHCQEALHHTSDPEGGLLNVAAVLTPDGELAHYVNRQKAPVRDFTDHFIRDSMSDMPYDQAVADRRDIAQLPKALVDLNATVTTPWIEVLGIEPGKYDVQRSIYHFFMKCFWNDEPDAEANATINFDSYPTQLASRPVVDESRGWFRRAGLRVTREYGYPYGITTWGSSGGRSRSSA